MVVAQWSGRFGQAGLILPGATVGTPVINETLGAECTKAWRAPSAEAPH
jgi:hypothetical protein